MADSTDLNTIFKTIREETLPSLGIEDEIIGRIIAARLLIERLGEADANYWWDSRVLSSFGNKSMGDTVPRTATRSQISLAMKVGQKVERELIGAQAISLFDLGPFVESQVRRELDEVTGDQDLSVLEEYSIQLSDTGWTDSLTDGEVAIEAGSEKSFELGSLDMDDLRAEDALDTIASQLIHGYGAATKNDLRIPYYKVNQ